MSREIQSYNNGIDKYENTPIYTVSPESSNSSEQGLDPRAIIMTVWKYKWLLLLFLLLGGTGAWFYAESLTPVYQSAGTIMITSNQDDDARGDLSRIISQTSGIGGNATLANELQVLGSFSFAMKAAEEIMDKTQSNADQFPVLWRETSEGDTVMADTVGVANRIQNNLNFMLVNKDSEVIRASFQSSSPREASEIVNTVMDLYVETSTLQNRQAAEYTTEFLAAEKEKLSRELQEAEDNLKAYMDNTGFVQLDNQSSGIVNRLTQIEVQIEDVELDLESVNLAISDQEEELERIRPGLAQDFSDAVAPRIRALQETMGDYEKERFLILQNYPNVRQRDVIPDRLKFLDKQIEALKTEITDLSKLIFSEEDEYLGMEASERTQMVTQIQGRLIELRMEKKQLESRLEVLEERIVKTEREFESLPNEMLRLAQLERDLEMKEKLFLNISQQFSDLSTWKETQYGYGRVIDYARIPYAPIYPRKMIILVMGVMLGGFICAGFIFVREIMNTTITSLDEFKYSGLPMLTAVPVLDKKLDKKNPKRFEGTNGLIPVEMVSLRQRSHIVSESIRRLKNNIVHQGHEMPKTIAITSPEKGDGKSTVAANLAVIFAEEGFKTLLIDSDFRRPRIHTLFGMQNITGLSNYIYGEAKVQQILGNSDLYNLKVVSTGSRTDKPESLPNHKVFMEFLDKMEQVFDVIIIDTSPFGIISDSTAILKRVDSSIVVARYRKTSKDVFMHTIDELGRINANISGFVLNDFDPSKDTGSYYSSGYYHKMYTEYKDYK